MLSFLRALVGCWHDWEKWSEVTMLSVDGRRAPGQMRRCRKCGKDQWRYA